MKNKKIAIWVIAIVAIIVIILGYRGISGKAISSSHDEFAKYLTAKGVTMYGTEWCPHCKNQKKMFGSSFKYIHYVDCDKNRNECLINGVTGYPTWKIDGINYPGEQSLERLASLAGYPG